GLSVWTPCGIRCSPRSSGNAAEAISAARQGAALPGRHAMANHCSPACVAEFADGQITRMTVWSANGKPDLRRGIRLAWAAYESRMLSKQPPAITALHFEAADGASVIRTQFTADQIMEATK